MHSVAAQERKVIMHMVATQMYTRIRIVSSDSLITSLVAVSIPALPAARMNSRPSRLFSLAKSCTAFTARSNVSALWSLRNTSTGAREQLLLYRPSARELEWFRTTGLSDRVRTEAVRVGEGGDGTSRYRGVQ